MSRPHRRSFGLSPLPFYITKLEVGLLNDALFLLSSAHGQIVWSPGFFENSNGNFIPPLKMRRSWDLVSYVRAGDKVPGGVYE